MKKTVRLISALLCACALFTLALTGGAQAQEPGYTAIEKVLATTSATPVIDGSALDISGATSTTGCYFNGISWYDGAGTYIDGAFTAGSATVNIRLDAEPGYYFAEGLSAYLNNSPVEYTIYNNSAYIVLERTYTPEAWAPTVIKHPGSELVDEGGWCSFVATASNAEKCEWKLIDANGRLYTMPQLADSYKSITYSDETFGKLVLRGITRELDGSRVYCTFSGAGGSADTNGANLRVDYVKPSPSPSPSAAPKPTEAPEDMSAGGAETGTATEHTEHSFSREWSFDSEKHWHECECGAREGESAHVMSWTTLREATKKQPGEEEGECGVCDYKTTRETEYVKSAESGRWILFAGMGAIVLAAVMMAASAAKRNSARRRYAKYGAHSGRNAHGGKYR